MEHKLLPIADAGLKPHQLRILQGLAKGQDIKKLSKGFDNSVTNVKSLILGIAAALKVPDECPFEEKVESIVSHYKKENVSSRNAASVSAENKNPNLSIETNEETKVSEKFMTSSTSTSGESNGQEPEKKDKTGVPFPADNPAAILARVREYQREHGLSDNAFVKKTGIAESVIPLLNKGRLPRTFSVEKLEAGLSGKPLPPPARVPKDTKQTIGRTYDQTIEKLIQIVLEDVYRHNTQDLLVSQILKKIEGDNGKKILENALHVYLEGVEGEELLALLELRDSVRK